MYFCASFIAASVVISVVSTATFNVTVGKDNHDPSFLMGVQNGDTIGFRLYVSKPSPRSVTQSAFDKPCTKNRANGIDSGLISAANFLEWSTNINDASAPLWFYRILYCNQGMVFAINPTAYNTFDAFGAAAKGLTLPSGVTTSFAAPSILSSVSTTPGTTTSSAATSLISTTSTNVTPTSNVGGALGQVSTDKVTLWLPTLGVVVGLTL